MINAGADPTIPNVLKDTPILKASRLKLTDLISIMQPIDESRVSTPSTAFSSNM